jgi:hypothetical protein
MALLRISIGCNCLFCSNGMVKESIVCEGEFNNLDGSVRGRY